MATESAITTEHSHPFSTGQDLCLVHNGSLSNHNRLRETLSRNGVQFKTDNDSEVAAGYLSWRLSEGDDLDQALNHAIEDLDGFYTFAIGTRDGFAVMLKSATLQKYVQLSASSMGVFDNNYFDLLPNHEKQLYFSTKDTDVTFQIRSLNLLP